MVLKGNLKISLDTCRILGYVPVIAVHHFFKNNNLTFMSSGGFMKWTYQKHIIMKAPRGLRGFLLEPFFLIFLHY